MNIKIQSQYSNPGCVRTYYVLYEGTGTQTVINYRHYLSTISISGITTDITTRYYSRRALPITTINGREYSKSGKIRDTKKRLFKSLTLEAAIRLAIKMSDEDNIHSPSVYESVLHLNDDVGKREWVEYSLGMIDKVLKYECDTNNAVMIDPGTRETVKAWPNHNNECSRDEVVRDVLMKEIVRITGSLFVSNYHIESITELKELLIEQIKTAKPSHNDCLVRVTTTN